MLKKTLFIMFLSLTSITLLAQQIKTISGVVTDATTGETLIGVAIIEPGTSNGTASDLDGNYTLDVKGDRISFSYVGYKSETLAVQNTSTLNVKLVSNSELDEVIVVGYTSQKKREVLGALTNVKSKELTQLPVSNTTEALQGRVAGVQVTNASGAPGAGATIRIRGVGSINSSNDPLYIIDGIPASNGLNSVIPTDIENISVLKDASASAIYGSRANNGVVLITTKKGKQGKAKVSYNGQFGAQIHGSLTEMANTSQYINIYNAAAKNDGRELLEGKWMKDFANVDHMKEIFQTGLMTIHDVSVSGGKDKFNYLASGSYYNQEGIIKNSKFEKFTGSTNLNYQATKWLKIGLSANAGKSTTDIVPSSGDGYGNDEGGSVVRYAYMRNPAIPVYDQNGKFVDKPSEYFGHAMYDTFFGEGYNPLGVAEMADRKRDETTVLSKINVEVKLPYNSIWNTNFGIDYKKSELNAYNQTWGTNDRINNPSSRSFASNEDLGWTLNSVLSSSHTFNDSHRLTAMVGTEAIRYNGTNKNAGSSINGDTQYSADWASSLLSFFGKVDYNYNYKYYLSALIRQDGSSRFAEGNRWGTFYALSAGWDVNEEEFFKPLTPVVNLLKLRAGWGAVGNQDVALYAYTDKYMPYANYPIGGGDPSLGYVQTQLGNTDLKWETSNQLNLGLDMAFLNGEYGFSADYYHKVTKDLLLQAPLPPSIGNAAPYWVNSGEVLNEGVDLEVYMRKQYKNAGFSIALNWGYLKNKMLKLDAPIQGGRVDTGIYAKLIEEGYSLGSYYLYEMDGIFQNESEIVRSAYQGANVQPGDVKYKDLNGDGVIDEKDRKHMGSSIPTQTLGLNLQGNLNNWDISVFFQGAFGNEIYRQIGHETDGFYRGFNVSKDYYDNYWRGEGTSNTHPRASWNAKSNNVMVSSRFLEDASYLRLKNVQIGYTFPTKGKLISNLRVFGSATNLFTFTKYNGLDPEMTVSANSSGEGDRGNGIDWGTYPVAKTFTLGVNMTF
ncbi:SusC/RagA family TonB-linked outer membrane protein [Dysgonomonas sp. HGC4]|uniref:SusC/RagA family TonB-linked outer membrane protein n=1 Tax=Dysgonomonas sp. HGC4 TaxID=1658009 RepID=UPI0006817BF3|nr:TonB-dependent receptor [Dysgonomonas sp. HGC4]MBD8348833.1 TonB-dependent receptor [Dysgonomonas sp. HGC4]